MRRVLTRLTAATMLCAALGAAPALAHEDRPVGDGSVRLSVGWGVEPPLTGFLNAATVEVHDGADRPVTGVTDLEVQVKTGALTADFALEPDDGTPGLYRAALIPTKAGTYSFRVTGTIRGQAVDQTFTSSETTFDSPEEPTAVQFPDKDPSAGQLSERIARESARAQAARAAADKAKDDASSAKTVGLAGIVVGALGLVVGAIALTRKR
jgi:hypothetical protein